MQRDLEHKARDQFNSFLIDCNVDNPQGKSILEIGFKNGLFMEVCQSHGMISFGTEMNPGYYGEVKNRFNPHQVILSDSTNIPLPDAFFDYIVSFQVLEHVERLDEVMAELVRLLSPGGTMYHICPNYHSFYEGHFKIIWLPFLGKTAGRYYVKLWRRYRPFYESLNFITRKSLSRLLSTYQSRLNIVSFGRAEFIQKFNTAQIEKINQPALRVFFRLVLKCKFAVRPILWLIAAADFYYPITLIARKNPQISPNIANRCE